MKKSRAVLAEKGKDPFHVLGNAVGDFTLSGEDREEGRETKGLPS